MTQPSKAPASMPLARSTPHALQKKKEDSEGAITEYVPFGGKDMIRMSVAGVKRYIAVKTRSGQNCSDDDAVKFIAMCKARALNPFEGDAFLIGYDSKDGAKFSLITAHQAFLKRAELHPEYDGMKSGVVISPGFQCAACDGERVIKTSTTVVVCPICNGAGLIDEIEGDIVPNEQELVGGWCTVFCKNRKVDMHKRIPIGPYRKPFGVWNDNPSGMIVKCAEADGMRSTFPTMLGGLYLREEIEMFPADTAHQSAPPPSFIGPSGDEPKNITNISSETQRPTQAQDDDQVPGAEVPSKTAQEPSGVDTPPPGTPEDEKEPAGQTSAQESAFQNVSTAGLDEAGLVRKLQETLKAANLTDDQLTAWTHSNPGMAKPNQKWFDLSSTKHRNFLEKWAGIGPKVAAMKG